MGSSYSAPIFDKRHDGQPVALMFVGVHQATGPVNPVELIARAAVVHRRVVPALPAMPVQIDQAE
jgi:hypothetical protein